MSVFQIELPDETVRQLEARAAAQNLDVQSWLREYIVTGLHEEDVASSQLAQKMDEALESGPPIATNDEWWPNLEREALALRDAQVK